MIELVKFIVSNIVDYPDDIKIEENVDESGTTILTLNVNPEDMGKVIGKGGKIISAVRELVKIKAIKLGKRVRLILEDPSQSPEDLTQSQPETETEIPLQPQESDQAEKIDQSSQSVPLETPPQTS